MQLHLRVSALSSGCRFITPMRKTGRAFSNTPAILFADEPTGNLDEETGEKVIQLLFDLNKDAGTTLVIVTHDLDLAKRNKHILRLKGGKILVDENTLIS